MRTNKYIFVCFIVLLLLLLASVTSVKADTTQLTSYTFNDSDDGPPQIDNGYATWSAYDASASQIYLYNIASGTTTQLTSGDDYHYAPLISNGKVLYEGDIDDTGELFLYDIGSATTTQITSGNYNNNMSPQLSGGYALWMGLDDELYLYDIANNSTSVITNSNNSVDQFSMNSGKVVWTQFDGDNAEVYLYDITTETTTQLTFNEYDAFPSTDGRYVVWSGNDSEIYLYDSTTGTTTQITHDVGENDNDGIPKVSGGKVVWANPDSELYIYDIASGTTTKLWNYESNTNNNGLYEHEINDGKVVWAGYDNTGTKIDIYDYDIASGTTTQLTNDTNQDEWPQVSDANIVWAKFVGHDWQIFLNTAAEATPTPTQTPTPTPTPVPTTLIPAADSYLNYYEQNQNEGGSPLLQIEQSIKGRVLVKFDENQIQSAVNGDPNFTAQLVFSITDNGNNWGSGKQIELDRMFQDWSEGNGYVNSNPNPNRGTGSGVTWKCASDSNISNNTKDCTTANTWDMTNAANYPFSAPPTATSLITNHESGTVTLDVTADVKNFLNGTNQNYGWILKRTDESSTGKVIFGSKESGNGPTLVITPQ